MCNKISPQSDISVREKGGYFSSRCGEDDLMQIGTKPSSPSRTRRTKKLDIRKGEAADSNADRLTPLSLARPVVQFFLYDGLFLHMHFPPFEIMILK